MTPEPTGLVFSDPGIRLVCENDSSFGAESFAALDDREPSSIWIVASATAVKSDRWARLHKSIAEGIRGSGPWADRPEDQIGPLGTDAVHDLLKDLCKTKFKPDEQQMKACAHSFWYLEWSIHFCCGLVEDAPPGFPSDASPSPQVQVSAAAAAACAPPAVAPNTDEASTEDLLTELLAKSDLVCLTKSQQDRWKQLYHHKISLPRGKGKPSPEDLELHQAFSAEEKAFTATLGKDAKNEHKKLTKNAKRLRQPNVTNKKGTKKEKAAAEASLSFRGDKKTEFSAIPNILRCQSLPQICAVTTKNMLMATGIKYWFDGNKFDSMSEADRDVEIAKTLLGRHEGKSAMGVEFLNDAASPVPYNNMRPVMERINPAGRSWSAQARFLVTELTMLLETEFGVDARTKRYLAWCVDGRAPPAHACPNPNPVLTLQDPIGHTGGWTVAQLNPIPKSTPPTHTKPQIWKS